jgi:mRNA interferase MazF
MPFLSNLSCTNASQPRQYIAGFDEIIEDNSKDFKQSGPKVTSVIRVGRLAVVSGDILLGAIGEISSERLNRVKNNLSNWLSEK